MVERDRASDERRGKPPSPEVLEWQRYLTQKVYVYWGRLNQHESGQPQVGSVY